VIRVLILFLLFATTAWSADITKIGSYHDLELGRNGVFSARLFEIYDLEIPGELEARVLEGSRATVIPSPDPKYGFTLIEGLTLPKKIYLGTPAQIRSGWIGGTSLAGTNAFGLIETDRAGRNRAVARMLSRLKRGTLIRVEAATLVRIRLSSGEILLLPNKGTWNKGRGTAPRGTIIPSAAGGVAEAKVEALYSLSGRSPGFAKSSGLMLQREIVNGKTDLNFDMKVEYWSDFVEWFETSKDRERNPLRELYEELVTENAIFSSEDWMKLGLAGSCTFLLEHPR